MNVSESVKRMHDQLTEIRRDIHAHPETAFSEFRTADLVARMLEDIGLEADRGLGKTGVVGTLRKGTSGRAVGLRADMDALFIHEDNKFDYRSTARGKMHACGHDGHTAMLLGAASYLSESGKFDGIVRFIFQPAEETGDERCGGNAMIQDGLFDKFPVECVFGMHNLPGLPVGSFAVRSGAMLASIDTFEFKVFGELSHPASQYNSPDPILIASRVVEAFHAFKARYVNPAEPVIVSITQFQAGDPVNDRQGVHVTPAEAHVRGTVYTLNDDIRDVLQQGLERTIQGICNGSEADYSFNYERGYPVLENSENEKELAVWAAVSVAGADCVEADMQPMMGAEDFAFMLKHRPGCYVFIGNGPAERASHPCHLHNSRYDFNDDATPVGVQYWVNLVERYLAPPGYDGRAG